MPPCQHLPLRFHPPGVGCVEGLAIFGQNRTDLLKPADLTLDLVGGSIEHCDTIIAEVGNVDLVPSC